MKSGDPSKTSKQMGDAGEMLVAAELTLAGVPCAKMPDGWPIYDLIAQPTEGPPQRISVKTRTYRSQGSAFAHYFDSHEFEWFAIVLLPGDGLEEREIYLIPRGWADENAPRKDRKTKRQEAGRYWRLWELSTQCCQFRSNFKLACSPQP